MMLQTTQACPAYLFEEDNPHAPNVETAPNHQSDINDHWDTPEPREELW
jgi:hypothetical protein